MPEEIRKPVAIILHGPSGVGKDTVIDILRERDHVHRPTSTTDRAPREDEVDGSHYHFVTTEQFNEKVARDEFIEHSVVYGQLKGLERTELEGPLSEGKDIIIRTDVQGARAWRELLEGAVFVFLTGDDEATMRARLEGRQTEDQASLEERVSVLQEELDDIANNDYVVLNRQGHVEEAVRQLEEILEAERSNPRRIAPRLRIPAERL